jgi:hypothetical protein
MKIITAAAASLLLCVGVMSAQVTRAKDSTIIFTPAKPELLMISDYTPLQNAWGFDIMLSNNGFAGGLFLRREYTEDIALSLSLAISDVKDDSEVEFYDPYTGQNFIPGKKNRLLLIPLVLSAQYRLFREDITDNFRPYVTAGVGPSMVFVSPYVRNTGRYYPGGQPEQEQVEFFNSLKDGQAKYTLGGYVGVGAYFGLDRATLTGLSVRYYVVPFRKGIELLEGGFVKTFGGFYITLNFGSLY